MSRLRNYDAVVDGKPTILRLTPEHAAKRGLSETKKVTPANKGRTPSGNKGRGRPAANAAAEAKAAAEKAAAEEKAAGAPSA